MYNFAFPDQVVWRPQGGSQVAFLSCPIFECLYEGTRGGGKEIHNDCKVLTDSGWKKVGEITHSDKLTAPDGTFTEILGIFPQPGQPELFRVTFEDGAHIDAGGPHRWSVRSAKNGSRDGWLVRTTDELRELLKQSIGKTRAEKNSWYIPTCQAMPGKPYSGLDAYAIGLMLGDGTTGSARATLYSQDEYILQHMVVNHGWARYRYEGQVERVVARNAASDTWKDAVGRFKGADKRVPQVLLEAEPSARLACLQGLMDTDGSVDSEGRIEFSNGALQLIKDVQYLVRSLGGKAAFNTAPTKRKTQRGGELPEYRLKITPCNKFNPFRLPRKAERVKPQRGEHRRIESIVPVGRGPATCFAVAHPSHQFVCQDFIVTHNTDCLIMDFAKECGLGYGSAWRGVLFRKTYKQLGDVIAKSKKWFPRIFGKRVKWNSTNASWEWATGEMLLLRHYDREGDYENYHGHEYPWLAFEELTSWASSVPLTKMMSTVRCPMKGVPMRVRSTTNPYGPGFNWVKRRYKLHLPIPDRRVMRGLKDENGNNLPDRVSIHSDVRENKILLEADPFYLDKLRASCRSEAERKAWIEGSWDIVAGGMFDDIWRTDIHNVLPFRIPEMWKIIPSFDWGSAKPFSLGWWAVSDGSDVQLRNGTYRSTLRGDVFRMREWYGCQENEPNVGLKLTAVDIAKGMVERQLKWGIQGIVRRGIADAAIFSVENGHSVAMDMEKDILLNNGQKYKGISWLPSDKRPGSRKLGWLACRQYLMNALPNPTTGMRERPGMFVFGHHCPDWLDTVLSLPRDPDDMDDVDTEAEDHQGDETRYFIFSRPSGAGIASRTGM